MGDKSFDAVALSYAAGVRGLFSTSGGGGAERGGGGPVSYHELADRAEELSSVSAALTAEAARDLRAAAGGDAAGGEQTPARLLAKAAADLRVGRYLLEAAKDEEDEIAWSRGDVGERSGGLKGDLDELLEVIAVGLEPAAPRVERGPRAQPRDPARELLVTAGEALSQISERVQEMGEAALGGLLGLAFGGVASVVGNLGLDVAGLLGQAEKVSRLYNYFRAFVENAYNSVLALLGPSVAQAAGQQVVGWVDEIKEAKFFGGLLERLYQVEQTKLALEQLVGAKGAEAAERYAEVNSRVERLDAEHAAQSGLVRKLLKGLKFFAGIPVAVLPQGALVVALIFLLLLCYVVLCGADYVDAPRLRVLNRTPGVRRVVEAALA